MRETNDHVRSTVTVNDDVINTIIIINCIYTHSPCKQNFNFKYEQSRKCDVINNKYNCPKVINNI